MLPALAGPYARVVLLGITDRDGATQAAAAVAALEADPGWAEASRPWRDARRGFEVRVYAPTGARGSGVADRAEGVLVRGADHGREKP
jgi:hypothetical protein